MWYVSVWIRTTKICRNVVLAQTVYRNSLGFWWFVVLSSSTIWLIESFACATVSTIVMVMVIHCQHQSRMCCLSRFCGYQSIKIIHACGKSRLRRVDIVLFYAYFDLLYIYFIFYKNKKYEPTRVSKNIKPYFALRYLVLWLTKKDSLWGGGNQSRPSCLGAVLLRRGARNLPSLLW